MLLCLFVHMLFLRNARCCDGTCVAIPNDGFCYALYHTVSVKYVRVSRTKMKCSEGLRSKTLLCSPLFYLPLSSRVPLFGFRYMRGLHNQIKVLEDRTAPKEEETDGTSHVHDSIISMGDNSMLMLGNGPMPGYGMPPPPQSMGGMDVGVTGLSGVTSRI